MSHALPLHAPEALRTMHPLFQAEEGGSIPTSALQLWVEAIAFEQAKGLNRLWHSRLPKFEIGFVQNMPSFDSYAATFEGRIYAVAIWSHPIARKLPQREWRELRRFAIAPDAPRNTASRVLRIMALLLKNGGGLTRLISYQDLGAHAGSIYKAAGWIPTASYAGAEWDTPSRPRAKGQAVAPRQRWEKAL